MNRGQRTTLGIVSVFISDNVEAHLESRDVGREPLRPQDAATIPFTEQQLLDGVAYALNPSEKSVH
jgi:hypothetical protein